EILIFRSSGGAGRDLPPPTPPLRPHRLPRLHRSPPPTSPRCSARIGDDRGPIQLIFQFKILISFIFFVVISSCCLHFSSSSYPSVPSFSFLRESFLHFFVNVFISSFYLSYSSHQSFITTIFLSHI